MILCSRRLHSKKYVLIYICAVLKQQQHNIVNAGDSDIVRKCSQTLIIAVLYSSRSFTRRSRVDLESHKRRISIPVRTACTIVRAAHSIDYAEAADPSVAQRNHRVGGEIPSLVWICVVKRKYLDLMTGVCVL